MKNIYDCPVAVFQIFEAKDVISISNDENLLEWDTTQN